jgi:hypothetical protein
VARDRAIAEKECAARIMCHESINQHYPAYKHIHEFAESLKHVPSEVLDGLVPLEQCMATLEAKLQVWS